MLTGEIYEYFGKILKENGIGKDLDNYQLRKLAKKQLFRALFDRNQAIYRKDGVPLRLFKLHFPSVYEIFSFIKTGKHNTLACTLQNLEAEIVLHKACKSLSLINPEMPLLTIHDSIASTIENYELIKGVLSRAIFDALNVHPDIRREPWDESLLKKNEASPGNENSPVVQISYGYVDENVLLAPQSYSMKAVANQLGIGHRTLCKGLREVGVFRHNARKQNCPLPDYITQELFILKSSKRGNVSIQTPRATVEGINLIKEIVKQNPQLFPEKRIKVV